MRIVTLEHLTTRTAVRNMKRWRLMASVSVIGLLINSGPVWAQCAPQPGALSVAVAVVCSDTGGTREGVTVEGIYSGTEVAITTTSNVHFGISVSAGGHVDLSGGTIETFGVQSFGIDIRTVADGSLSATDYSVTTYGEQADAITLHGVDVFVRLDRVHLSTHGSDATGIEAFGGSRVEGSDVAIDINVPSGGTGFSHGLWLDNLSEVTLSNLTIDVDGRDSSGVVVWSGILVGEDANISVTSDFLSGNAGYMPAGVYVYGVDGRASIARGSISTFGQENHAVLSDGGVIELHDMDVAARGTSSSAIFFNNFDSADRGLVQVRGGSLSSVDAPLILAEGGLGSISLIGPIGLNAPTLGGRKIFAHVTNGVRDSDVDLTLTDVTTAVGDIDVTGTDNTLRATFVGSEWVGDLRVDPGAGNTADITLRGSRWTGWA
jgi:hypothetical protein